MQTITHAGREAGLELLGQFAGSAGSRYTKTRNFDFGPERRGNVSQLSPYIRHRLLLERELLESTLQQHSQSAASKFVQEVFWRAYFKGWLEQRPSVWTDYRSSVAAELENLEADAGMHDRYEKATAGATGIDCFDAWVSELVGTGYLHNHARMWFASIWVFTLGLPWQLGADFFLRHLMDGDPASNTLSWRWVCGLHTKGKTYLARASNIANYTDSRFNPQGQLALSAPPLEETRDHPRRLIPNADALPAEGRAGLLVTEEDCHVESVLAGLRPCSLIGAVATRRRSPLPIGNAAAAFASGAVKDGLARAKAHFQIDGEFVEADSWGDLLAGWATSHHLDIIVTPYAPVGPVDDALASAQPQLDRHGLRLLRIRREYDDVTWPHATGGYFKLKDKIPSMLDRLGIAN